VDIDDLYRLSRRGALAGMSVNLALGLAKLIGGLTGHSVALLSDAVHSLGDTIMSAVVLAALVWSQQPPDREHPYGHTRAEAVAGSNVALLLLLSALWVIWEALHTLAGPVEEPATYTLWIAAASAVLQEGLYHYNSRVAHRTGSTALSATAWDQRLDAFTSLAVLVGIGLARWGGPGWHWADHVVAVGVAVTILWAGWRLFWASLQELMDRQAGPELLAEVRRDALAVPGVRGVEKLLVRKTGLEYLVDIHVEVDPLLTVRDGHTIAHAVKDRLVRSVLSVRDVLVHIEPAPSRNGEPAPPAPGRPG
jgi:cation diffusion facilitator family transporter